MIKRNVIKVNLRNNGEPTQIQSDDFSRPLQTSMRLTI